MQISLITSFFIFILGLSVGSFLNVCISRLPKRESIIFPSSCCPSCRSRLKVLDLFPVLSFILLRGRCRYCGGKISIRYPLVEILTGSFFLALFLKFSFSLDLVLYLFFFSLLTIAAFSDLETEIIPDSVSILGAIPGLLISLLKGVPATSFSGMILGFVIMWLLLKSATFIYRKEAMGQGDVKLAMMIGAYLGWQGVLVALFLAFVSGAIIGLVLIGIRMRKFGEHIPFGPFLALGAVASVFFGSLIWNWYVGILF